jgi:predicted nucleotidyltransferase
MKPYEAPEIQEKLTAIKEAVLTVAPDAEAIYLFGSYANGTPHEGSDLDIFVVVPDRNMSEVKLIWEIQALVREKLNNFMGYDLLLNYSNSFYKNLNYPTFDKIAVTTGVKIYG